MSTPYGTQITINPMPQKRSKSLGKDIYVGNIGLNYKSTYEQFLNWVKSDKNDIKYKKNIIDTEFPHNAINNVCLLTD